MTEGWFFLVHREEKRKEKEEENAFVSGNIEGLCLLFQSRSLSTKIERILILSIRQSTPIPISPPFLTELL